MRLSQLVILSLLMAFFTSLNASTPEELEEDKLGYRKCLSTREYITTIKYLRDKKEFQLPEKGARKIADQVSKGCSGASQRFIDVTNLLIKAQLDSKSAVDLGMIYALSDDQKTKSFMTIFKQAFLGKYLDLDVFSAMKMAKKLSLHQDSNAAWVVKDFNNLVQFCVEKAGLNLPLPACAKMASSVANQGNRYKARIARPFLKLYYFLVKKNGGGLPLHQALKISREIITMGPNAPKNFVQAYKYAIRPKGLELSQNEAIAFATQMASRSIKEIEGEKKGAKIGR